ncbi:MAG: hypothetical protein PHT80_07995 [Lentisphaeria bacterium]|nr:hypothetical protein [Lentisphaeria bacterium]
MRYHALYYLAAISASMLGAQPIHCPGQYRGHLQGIATDGQHIYWSFTVNIVTTDLAGNLLANMPVRSHHGDLCYHDGKIYVAVNFGRFNTEDGANSHVYVYQADNLALLAKHPVPELVHGAGGMDYRDGRFYVIGGLPKDHQQNYVYEYDDTFTFIKRHVIESGQTLMGIQTACFAHGSWWFGCYGKPALLQCDPDFKLLGKHDFNTAVGLAVLSDGSLIAGRTPKLPDPEREGRFLYTGHVITATLDPAQGIRAVPTPPQK